MMVLVILIRLYGYSCDFEIFGCMDMSAINYNADATVDDGSCDFEIFGCMDMSAINYNADATVDDGSCDFEIFGCTDPMALNHNPDATIDNGSCDYDHSACIFPPEYFGNTGGNMTVFLTSGVISSLPLTSPNPYIVSLTSSGLVVGSASLAQNDLIGGQQSLAVWGDDSSTPEVDGALAGEELYFQLVDGYTLYDLDISFAGPNSYTINNQLPAIGVIDNFVCSQEDILEDIFGCMDMSAINYNADATVDDGSCDFEIFGCMDMSAINYNADATVDDGSCDFEIFGCTDPMALNHNPDATIDNGSCDYDHSACIFPPEYFGNTGGNMTVFLTSGVISSLPLTSPNPYIVSLTSSGLVVGSASLAQNDLIGGQQSLAVWGDDSSTPEVDGALAGEELYFQLVDGYTLYDLDISFAGPNSYTINNQLPAIGVIDNFVCSQEDKIRLYGYVCN